MWTEVPTQHQENHKITPQFIVNHFQGCARLPEILQNLVSARFCGVCAR